MLYWVNHSFRPAHRNWLSKSRTNRGGGRRAGNAMLSSPPSQSAGGVTPEPVQSSDSLPDEARRPHPVRAATHVAAGETPRESLASGRAARLSSRSVSPRWFPVEWGQPHAVTRTPGAPRLPPNACSQRRTHTRRACASAGWGETGRAAESSGGVPAEESRGQGAGGPVARDCRTTIRGQVAFQVTLPRGRWEGSGSRY